MGQPEGSPMLSCTQCPRLSYGAVCAMRIHILGPLGADGVVAYVHQKVRFQLRVYERDWVRSLLQPLVPRNMNASTGVDHY